MVIANFWWIVGAFAVGYIISGIIYRMGQNKRDTHIIEATVAQTKETMSVMFIQRLHDLGYDIEEMKERERHLVQTGQPLSDVPSTTEKQSFGFDLKSSNK